LTFTDEVKRRRIYISFIFATLLLTGKKKPLVFIKMSEEEYKTLPLDQLLEHKLWKARQYGYTQLKELAESNINDESIIELSNNIEKLKKIVGDTNVISQESGVQTFSILLKLLGPRFSIQTRDSLVPIIVEKGLTSSRINAKNYSTESLLLFSEFDSPGLIIELMVPFLNAKSPKQITATIKGITEIYKEFGCNVVDPKIIMEHIVKMFAHSDKNVRADASTLSVTIRSHIGDSFDKVIFPKLKPIQQKDLTSLFDKIESNIKPNRLLYIEQQKLKMKNEIIDDDVEMTDVIVRSIEHKEKAFDPYTLEDPIDVLTKLPDNLSTRVTDSVWKERVEVLEEIGKHFKVNKIQNDDYAYFISLMIGCLRDVNLQVVTLACGILTDLANGLRTNFSKYSLSLVSPLLERTKEKKKSVLDALNEVLDLCFKYGSFHEILEPIIERMKHISPPVKVETMQFLVRCLNEIESVPNKIEADQIMTTAIKLLQDSQLAVRNSASDVIGTLMKIIGPEQSKCYLDKIDKRHIKRVQQVCDAAIVKSFPESKNKNTLNPSKINKLQNNKIPDLHAASFNNENRRVSSISNSEKTSIPSKRTATSPLKENIPNHKNTLTARSLKASNVNSYGLSTQQLQEFEFLKTEKMDWLKDRKELSDELDDVKNNNDELLKNVVSLNNKLEDYHNKFTTMSMTLKSKDTQIFRLRSDLETSQAKNAQLQQKIKIFESQLEILNKDNKNDMINITNNVNDDFSGLENKLNTDDSNDINRRISILSIDSNVDEPKSDGLLKMNSSSLYNFDDNDDGWKRATAVTNNLKAKIQQMKARTRLLDPADE
jgi:cytoskeleton-associated protein 5